jgi:hypothetical protein
MPAASKAEMWKRSAEKAGRRKQEPKGDSTPDQAEKEKDPQGS